MRHGLAATLANISAVRASTNTAGESPSGMAVANNFEQRSDDVRQQKVKNIMAQVSEDQKASQFYAKSAQSDLLGGLLGAAGGAMSGLSGAFKSGGFGS
jgi:predicted lipid-binding transport protein (Tim44 family)